MAIKAPTPPTAPAAPVVPGAEQHTDMDLGQTGQTGGNGQEDGREFGVHVTITNPTQNNQAGLSHSTSQTQGTSASDSQPQQEDKQASQSDVAQQARQDMVQQALGMKNQEEVQQGQESTQQNVTESSWPLPGSHMPAMSFVPLLIVFIAAFVTFMLRNLSKKPQLKSQQSGARAAGAEQGVYPERTAGEAKKKDKNKGSRFEMRI